MKIELPAPFLLPLLLFIAALLGGCGSSEPPPLPPAPPCFEPDRDFQALYREACRIGASDTSAGIQVLDQKVRANRIDGIRQSLVFVASSTQENRWQFVLKLYESLSLSKDEMLQSALPCLESGDPSMDEPVRSVILPFLVSKSASGMADFAFLQGFLSKRKENPPLKLVKMLYQSSPSAALDLMASVYTEDASERGVLLARKELIGGDHLNLFFDQAEKRRSIAPGVREVLIESAKSPHWWLRLYIAEVVGHTRGFSDAEIQGLLAEDSHELVREAIALQVERKGRG